MTASDREPVTEAGKRAAFDGLTGCDVATILAIEAEAAASATARAELAERIVKRAAGMGLCSQTHHEHLMVAARDYFDPPDPEDEA